MLCRKVALCPETDRYNGIILLGLVIRYHNNEADKRHHLLLRVGVLRGFVLTLSVGLSPS